MISKIYIYTSNYPFSKTSEAFFETEIGFSRGVFSDITIVPVNGDRIRRDVPEGIKVDEKLAKRSVRISIRAILGLFTIKVLKNSRDFPRSIYFLKDLIKYLYAANLIYYDLKCRIKDETDPVVLYSYWLTYPPIAFAWIKNKYPDKCIFTVSRAHGSDVYSTDVGVYYPKRNLVMNRTNLIVTVSSYGKEYLIKKYGGKTPITVSRLGVSDNFQNNIKKSEDVNIVSCSSLIPLKRVSLLFASLNNYSNSHPNLTLTWTHIGSGPLMDELRKKTEVRAPNLCVKWAGSLNNSDILKLYRENYFDCYILLSESEGIPVSIMEAISSGIPVISTDVGGVSEIVNEKTGILLTKNFNEKSFNDALDFIVNNQSMRNSAYDFFKKNYEAKSNYTEFYKKISSFI